MFTGLGKKQADTDLEMVVQGGMMSQKAKEGGKSVFYLPVMSSFFFFCWVSCLQRSLTGNIWQRHHWNQELVFGERERSGHEYITFPCEWLGPSMNTLLTYCLCMSVRGKSYGRPIWIGIWLLWSEAAAGWDFCLNTCESGDRETRISPVTRTLHTESSSKIKELFLFKTSAYLVQADGIYDLQSAYVANFAFCPPCFKNN